MRRSSADGGQNGGWRNLSADGGEKPIVGNRRGNVRRRKSSKRRERTRIARVLGDRSAGAVVASIDQLRTVGRTDHDLEGLAVLAGKVRHEAGGDEGLQHECNEQCVAQPHTPSPFRAGADHPLQFGHALGRLRHARRGTPGPISGSLNEVP